MATIVHLSDIHFGRVDPALCEQVLGFVREHRPTVTVISGDLTQRAREAQYLAAKRFIDQIEGPVVVIPGNHDVPLYDVLRRFFRPLERFQRIITSDLYPTYSDNDFHVVGVNSTRAFTLDPHGFWKNGTLSDEQLKEVDRRMAQARPGALRVLVMHHPLVNPWNAGPRDTCRGRDRIIFTLESAGVELVLSGHLHIPFTRHAPAQALAAGKILCLQAGTATSNRLRENHANAFNMLQWNGKQLDLTVMRHDGGEFYAQATQQFELRRM